jgi:hypothetical protein
MKDIGKQHKIWTLERFYNVNTTWFLKKYYSGDQIKKSEMGGACSMYGGVVYRVLVGKPDGKRPLRRPRHRWEDNIKMDLQELG